eukprot:g11024.t1 g11024   contig47:2562-3425(-)
MKLFLSSVITLTLCLSGHDAIATNSISSSLLTEQVATSYLETTSIEKKERRVRPFQRNQINAASSTNTPDVGLLFSRHRSLQLENSTSSGCPLSCDPELCSCVTIYDTAEDCYQQLHSVCSGTKVGTDGHGNSSVTFSIDQCVVSDYLYYYDNVYCPFAECRVGGGSFINCYCQSYVNFCDIYETKPGYEEEDKTIKYCAIAKCCEINEGDEDAMGGCLDDAASSAPSQAPEGEDAGGAPSPGGGGGSDGEPAAMDKSNSGATLMISNDFTIFIGSMVGAAVLWFAL